MSLVCAEMAPDASITYKVEKVKSNKYTPGSGPTRVCGWAII